MRACFDWLSKDADAWEDFLQLLYDLEQSAIHKQDTGTWEEVLAARGKKDVVNSFRTQMSKEEAANV